MTANSKQTPLGIYPDAPGFQDTDTSMAAAASVETEAGTLRRRALELLRKALTADEVAEAIEKSVLSIRPRVTELNKMGLIRDTGQRRFNRSGRRAIVWKGTP